MDTDEICAILRGSLKSKFCGVYALDELVRTPFPHRPCGIVCNTQPSSAPGEHWVAIWLKEDGSAEYFDSFAQKPVNVIRQFLNKQTSCGWIRNHRRLQSAYTTVCGGFVILYLYARHTKQNWTMDTLIKRLFPFRDPWKNDKRVQNLMWKLFKYSLPILDSYTVNRMLHSTA